MRIRPSQLVLRVQIHSSSTVMASVGQEVTQAIQRMQSSSLTGTDFSVSGYSGRS